MTICLVMLMKNEAKSMAALCDSVRPAIDRWVLLDTGSTDGTAEVAIEKLGDLPYKVVTGDFVDFATSRNEALDLAGDDATFTLFLSGDERLEGARELRAFCEAHESSGDGAYYVQIQIGDNSFDSGRLARASAGWRYRGAVHEVLMGPADERPRQRVPGAVIRHDLTERDAERHRKRFERDRVLLEQQVAKNPNDTRATFYLAQTEECLHNYGKALQLYEQRAQMGGWREEVYEALYRCGRVSLSAGKPWPEAAARYLDAHLHAPHRAEPLVALAEHYARRREWPIAYLYARRAAELPLPQSDILFVDRATYEMKALELYAASAYYVGDHEEGRKAAAELLRRSPDDPRLAENLAFYDERR